MVSPSLEAGNSVFFGDSATTWLRRVRSQQRPQNFQDEVAVNPCVVPFGNSSLDEWRITAYFYRAGIIARFQRWIKQNTPDREFLMAKITDSRQLGQLVRDRRKQADLTLKDAAGMAGVGVRFLSELERGKPTVQLGLAIRVLQLFGLELHVHARGETR